MLRAGFWQQFEKHGSALFRLDFARGVASAKIANSRAVLGRLARNGHGQQMRAAMKCLKNQAESARSASDAAILRGIEGSAASRYFAALREVLPVGLGFGVRARRPAPDPFNALLNLGYTLVGNELWSALESCGLDPYLGFFHVEKHGRPALALDLLEEFRAPLVDRLALSLFNTRALQRCDFDFSSGAARLHPASLKKFLAAYERAVNAPFTDRRNGDTTSFRRLFGLQARCLARVVEGGEAYLSYRHR